ncbi:E3 ubiquitin-protein ligase TRIM21-like [Periophthalmus magnuspinnatus]|uniref:E3 ubiquitin-protein ligase TRIM21-like n=1 Tax=Periophthalmus magnuspinnatus TaxID=409849 RepID=UPI00145BB3E1|nr:E3 ubiquitin-protein ligase TRIM21-like [Periophthalmus magnuspinnatus]
MATSPVSPLTEDQLLCPICLEVFKDPISTPCGHNFCKNCISKHWDNELSCPMCKKDFSCRPPLHVNTFISEICSQFMNPTMEKSVELYLANETGGITCDICTGHKLTAVKSCPVCLFSYCQNHLEPHLTVPRLQKHHLMEPIENLEERMCSEHDKPLELFCLRDQVCVCMACTILDHKNHDIIPLKEEFDNRQGSLKQIKSENRHLIEERQDKVQKVRQSVELSRSCAQREMNNGMVFFNAVLEIVQTSMAEFQNEILTKQRANEKEADALISELESEICQLEGRDVKMGQIACSDDYLHAIQSFKSLKIAPKMKDWSLVKYAPTLFECTVKKAVAKLEHSFMDQKKLLTPQAELRRLQQHAVNITLDPDTASPWLTLSDDRKEVSDRGKKTAVPHNPQRFSNFLCVLGKQGFNSGKFYYEVQVKRNENWDVGVVKESIDKKDKNFLFSKNGTWAVMLRDRDKYSASASPRVELLVKSVLQRLGVFVDYELGLVSFYNAETAEHLYSFTNCNFFGKLYPFFSPGNRVNGFPFTPLIIKPVKKV